MTPRCLKPLMARELLDPAGGERGVKDCELDAGAPAGERHARRWRRCALSLAVLAARYGMAPAWPDATRTGGTTTFSNAGGGGLRGGYPCKQGYFCSRGVSPKMSQFAALRIRFRPRE